MKRLAGILPEAFLIENLRKRAEIKEELRDEFEEDLKLQLKRQSAAHAAHLTEELAILRQAQEQKAQAELDSQITSLSTKYLDDISQGQS